MAGARPDRTIQGRPRFTGTGLHPCVGGSLNVRQKAIVFVNDDPRRITPVNFLWLIRVQGRRFGRFDEWVGTQAFDVAFDTGVQAIDHVIECASRRH